MPTDGHSLIMASTPAENEALNQAFNIFRKIKSIGDQDK